MEAVKESSTSRSLSITSETVQTRLFGQMYFVIFCILVTPIFVGFVAPTDVAVVGDR